MSKYKSESELHFSNTATIFMEVDYPSPMAILMRCQLPLSLFWSVRIEGYV